MLKEISNTVYGAEEMTVPGGPIRPYSKKVIIDPPLKQPRRDGRDFH